MGAPATGSASVGSVTSGHLIEGLELPLTGAHHAVFEGHRVRGTNWGTDELVQAVLAASGEVASAFPGAVLQIGNVAKFGGGALPWSISHKAGRDVDVGFYVLDASGNQVLPPAMLQLTPPDGTAMWDGQEVRFDPARNWVFFRSLLSGEKSEVQYVFVADFLIKLMREYALAEGDKVEWLDSLNGVLRQPRGTLPHDDHAHIRFYCSPEDLSEGCRNIVAGREIVPVDDQGYQQRVRAAAAAATDSSRPLQERIDGLRMLAALRAPGGAGVAYKALADCADDLCAEAVFTLEALGARPRTKDLVKLVERTSSPGVVAGAFRLLRRAPASDHRRVLKLLFDQRTLASTVHFFERELTVRREACYLAGWLGDPAAGADLAEVLAEDSRRDVREAALWGLRAISASEVFPDSYVDSPPLGLRARWKRWHRRHRDRTRELRRTLEAAGFDVSRRLGARDSRKMLDAIRGEDYVSLNVQRRLEELHQARIPLSLKDKPHARWLWKKHLRKVRSRNRRIRRK